MNRRRALTMACRRGLSLLATLAALISAPLSAQELHTTFDQGPGMPIVACGEVSPPSVDLVWQEAATEGSRTALGLREVTLLLINRTSDELLVEVQITLDANDRTTQRRLPAVRLDGGATEAVAVALEDLQERPGGREKRVSFVAAHAWISSFNDEALGQSTSPVLYLRAELGGGLTAFGEEILRQREKAEVLTAAATTGAPGLPEGVTLEMAFEAGEGEPRLAIEGPDDAVMQELERVLALTRTMDSEDEEMDR